MSTQTTELYVPGPLHPDLFGGETPLMVPLQEVPRVYGVEVGFTVTTRESVRLDVAATSEEEAARLALEQAEDQAAEDEDDFDVEDVEALDADPSDKQLQAWIARREVRQ